MNYVLASGTVRRLRITKGYEDPAFTERGKSLVGVLGGVPAPTMLESDGTYSTGRHIPVVWRLIWEDTRYLDGQIPLEELDYSADDEVAVSQAVHLPAHHDLLSARTDDICPRSDE